MSWIITGTQKKNWTPAEIDTALWLDAADASTVTEVGGAVTTWTDKSGNGHNATAAGNPTYSATGMSTNKPAVQLDGTGDSFTSSITGIGSFNALDVYMVTQTTAAAAADTNSGIFWGYGNLGSAVGIYPYAKGLSFASATGLLSEELITNYYELTPLTGRLGSSLYTRPANTAQILNSKNSTTGSSSFANGSQIDYNLLYGMTTSTNTAPSILGYTTDSSFYVGALRANGVLERSPAIKFAEVIVSSTLLSTVNRQKLEGYLAHKWGLTANLPADHPYKTAVPVP